MVRLIVGEVGEEVLMVLKREAVLNTRQIANRLGKNYHHIRDVLLELKRKDLVKNEMVKRYVPLTKAWVIVNEWSLTPEGEKYLERMLSRRAGGFRGR